MMDGEKDGWTGGRKDGLSISYLPCVPALGEFPLLGRAGHFRPGFLRIPPLYMQTVRLRLTEISKLANC